MFKLINNPSPKQIGDGQPDTAVLFLHGLGGSYNTWNQFANHLKDKWIEADCFGLEYDEYYGSQGFFHNLPVFKFFIKLRRIIIGPDLTKLSLHLKTIVDEVCEAYENVIIVAHSMGGLIARKYIINTLDETKSVGKVRCLITYATPHHGSILANHYLTVSYSFFRFFFKDSKQITQLSIGSEFIETLNLKWSNLRVEDKIEFFRVVGLEDWVVDADSSSYKDDPNAKLISGKNHSSIIKPDTRKNKDGAFMVTYNYLKNFRKNYQMKLELQSEIDIEYDDFDFDYPIEE